MSNFKQWLEVRKNYFDQIFENPDPATLRSCADWLQDQGDSFGEEMASVLLGDSNFIRGQKYEMSSFSGIVHVMEDRAANIKTHYIYWVGGKESPKVSVSRSWYNHVGDHGVLDYMSQYTGRRYGSDPMESNPMHIDKFTNHTSLYAAGDAVKYSRLPSEVFRLIILGLCELAADRTR